MSPTISGEKGGKRGRKGTIEVRGKNQFEMCFLEFSNLLISKLTPKMKETKQEPWKPNKTGGNQQIAVQELTPEPAAND